MNVSRLEMSQHSRGSYKIHAMKKLINHLMRAVRYYTAADFAVFKIYLISVGILLGAYFSSFFLAYINVIWVIAIAGLIILLIQTIRYCRKTKD